jgi:2-iminobutanoate/2-iminopropanoate deaminase
MLKEHAPATMAPAFSRYALGIEVTDAARWLHVSGQVGVAADGTLAEGAEAQMEQAWRNILTILASADMAAENLVKVTAFLTRREDLGAYRVARDRVLGTAKPASTLLYVSGLADPAWLVEIEAVAAK